jgi:glyoxylase-like metal-dependent hydrolase (beta-lactamase superfamily II)
VQVRRLSTGRVRPKRATSGVRRYLPGGWSDQTLPVYAYVVEHPGGLCLFDTGQTARAAEPGYLPRWHPFLRLARFELDPEDEAAAQVDPLDVRWVVLSHLHTDHVGGLAPFVTAEVLVSRVEWDRARGVAGRFRGYIPQHWPEGLEPTLVDYGDPPNGPFPGCFDVAGDGELLLIPTPGHTPGHMALLTDSVLLVGDMSVGPGIESYCAANGIEILGAHR